MNLTNQQLSSPPVLFLCKLFRALALKCPRAYFSSSKCGVRSVGGLEEGFGGKNMSVLGENKQTPDAHYDDQDDDDASHLKYS